MSYLMNVLGYLMLNEEIKNYYKEKKEKDMLNIKDLKVGDKIKLIDDDAILTIRYIDSDDRYIVVVFENGGPYIIKDTSLKDYEKYKEHKILKWTEWQKEANIYKDPFDYTQHVISYEIRNNGKRVQVRSGATKAFASCDETKGDEFDYKFGKDLALKRLIVKRISEEVEAGAKDNCK